MKTHGPDIISQTLAEPSRRAILECLQFGAKSVNEIVHLTQLKQPNVSNHLAKMREQGVVRSERSGRQVHYSIASPFADILLRLHEITTDPRHESNDQDLPPLPFDGNGMLNGSSHAAETANGSPHDNEEVTGLGEWQNAYFQSLLNGQEDRANALVNSLLAHRLNMETIYVRIFQWSLKRIGELYLKGVIDEAHEHIASAITERMMSRVSHFYTPIVRHARKAVFGCVAGNFHVLGLRMLADGLRNFGWETVFIGANVPSASFLKTVATAAPNLVVLSCTLAEQFAETQDLCRKLATLRYSTPELDFQIVAGGHYFLENPEALKEIHCDYSASSLSDFLHTTQERFPLPSRASAV